MNVFKQRFFLMPMPVVKCLATSVLVATASLSTSLVQADALADLLQEVKSEQAAEGKRDKAREQRFLSSLQEQKTLLAQANKEVNKQVTMRDKLKGQFDTNEIELTELTELLSRRTGDLGELFGVFRQMAADSQSKMYDSLISLERPERKVAIDALASRKEVPRIQEMKVLWTMLMDEIVESGKVTRFAADVVKPSGEHYDAQVTRIGVFNVVTDDLYLNYLPENDQLVEFARQPAGYVRDTAGELSAASGGGPVGFAIDPSRGVLLSLLVQSPNLMERVEQGRQVGYAIILVTIVGLLVVAGRLFSLGRINAKMQAQLKDMDHFDEGNPLGRALSAYYACRHLPVDVLTRKLDEIILKDVTEIRKGLPLIKVLAAIAPLMGLLGTVTGMIGTFQAITLFGTGDPKLMAGGISQALVTTVLGLVAAIPLLLSHSVLSSRAQSLTKLLAEQAAGMVATQAEKLAEGKK